MPQPTASDVHIKRPLTNISVAYLQQASAFIAGKVFPNIPVQNQADMYWEYAKGDFMRDEMRIRALSTESAGGGYSVDANPTYSCQVWSMHKDIDDRVRANADAPLNPDREATEWLTQKALIRRERIFASEYFTTGKWGTDITGVDSGPSSGQTIRWNQSASAPVEDIDGGIDVVLQSTGYKPRFLVLGRQAWTGLKHNAEIIDRIKYQGSSDNPAKVTTKTVAALFELEDVLVMESVYNTAAKGQTATPTFIGGKNALLVYSAPSPGIMQPSAGYTFSWNGYLGASAFGSRIKSFRMEELNSDRVEIEMALDMKLVGADLGYFFSSIVD